MKSLILTALIAGGMVGSYVLYPKVVPVVSQKLQQTKLPILSKGTQTATLSNAVNEQQVGQVKGIMTQAGEFISGLTQNGSAVTKTAATIVTTTPSSSGEVIDVSKVVAQIANQVEGVPSTVLSQAKVQYCLQVLKNATASASP